MPPPLPEMVHPSAVRRRPARAPKTQWWQTPVAQGVGIVLAGAVLQRTRLLRDNELFATTAVVCAAMLSGSLVHIGDRVGDSLTHVGDCLGGSITHVGDCVGDSLTHVGDRVGDSFRHCGDGFASIGASLDGVGEGVRAMGQRCVSFVVTPHIPVCPKPPAPRSFAATGGGGVFSPPHALPRRVKQVGNPSPSRPRRCETCGRFHNPDDPCCGS